MSTVHNSPVSEKELDNLLAQAFLNLDFNDSKNNELMETISTHHLVNTPAFSYTLKQFLSGKFFIGMLLLGIAAAFILSRFTNDEKPAEPATTTRVSAQNDVAVNSNPVETNSEVFNASDAIQAENTSNETPGNESQPGSLVNGEPNDESTTNKLHHTQPVYADFVKQPKDSAYIFPVLTAEEKKAHDKQKNKMVSALVKINKDKYAYIPTGSCDYKNQTISVKAFYAQTTEVSNLEYRTFLSDLILQGRKQEFLAALPDQTQWIKRMPHSYDEPMTTLYFSHSAYDDYPVVNISRKGAEMYCKWLTTEVNNTLKANNKSLITDLRLPDEYEWVYAAYNGKTRLKYANGNTHLRNSKGAYEMNFVCHSMEECRYDSTLQIYLPVIDKWGYYEDGAFYTARVTSYEPNAYGLYCMAGNVSEMIVEHSTQKPATKGGSWFSCDHFLEIEAEDEHRGEINPSPFIGFRPVFSAQVLE